VGGRLQRAALLSGAAFCGKGRSGCVSAEAPEELRMHCPRSPCLLVCTVPEEQCCYSETSLFRNSVLN